MKETQVIVIRHGETHWNVEKKWQGHLDSSLTQKGILQANLVGKSLADSGASTVYTSDLGRAVNTAEIISGYTGTEVFTNNKLRERNTGIFQGLTRSEIASRYPDHFSKELSKDPDFKPPEGESVREQYERIVKGFTEVTSGHEGETIIVVTHGGVLNLLFRWVIGIPLDAPRRYALRNTAKNVFSVVNGQWKLISFGEVNHLESLEATDDDSVT